MGEKPPLEDKSVTHGICEECRRKYFPNKGGEVMEEYHHSPISKHCEQVLAHPPECTDFRKIRSWVMCRAFEILDKEGRRKLPVGEAWQEARGICT